MGSMATGEATTCTVYCLVVADEHELTSFLINISSQFMWPVICRMLAPLKLSHYPAKTPASGRVVFIVSMIFWALSHATPLIVLQELYPPFLFFPGHPTVLYNQRRITLSIMNLFPVRITISNLKTVMKENATSRNN